eukprot:gnl/Dysnectes_brevis/815_a900_5034.p1 GENE.gnl/Dysnectes_brevis/815_a900_5034~~gnl/Dysnectes_brevis/815_a900_5034.p1  ORF type:complete len:384 (-),score=100.81 gnl/Dysnectes_brevis/815_a900_5034:74-1183(-)
MGILEDITSVKTEISKTQKNKATEHHLGRLKAKLSRLESQLILESSRGKGGGGTGFDVAKTGHARVCLLGFPSVGKSTLLTKLTSAKSEVADYEFTTLTAIPGTFIHKGTKIQLVDLPGIIEGAKDGKGRGRQVIATARTADLMLIVMDATKPLPMKRKVERELEGFGIRLNKRPSDIVVTRKERGGISFSATGPTRYLDETIVSSVLIEMKIHNADVVVRDQFATVDDLIDVIEGNRVYMPALYVVNKIDAITIEELDLFDELPNWVPISAGHEWNLDELLDRVWEKLNIIRVYTKPRSGDIDYTEPVIMRLGRQTPTVEAFCRSIHKDMVDQMKFAMVWGRSVKFPGQHVGKDHILADEDVVTVITQ